VLFFTLVTLLFLFAQAERVMVDYWLSIWVDREYHLSTKIYVISYACFATGAIVLSLSRALMFTDGLIESTISALKFMSFRMLALLQEPSCCHLAGLSCSRRQPYFRLSRCMGAWQREYSGPQNYFLTRYLLCIILRALGIQDRFISNSKPLNYIFESQEQLCMSCLFVFSCRILWEG
jgi:hypothetical protein